MNRPRLKIIGLQSGGYRVELDGTDLTRFISNLSIDVQSEDINASTRGSVARTRVNGLQETSVTFTLRNIEIVHAGETNAKDVKRIGAFRMIGGT